jgi:peptide deformylase
MAQRPVLIWPDPILSQKALPVSAVTPATRALVADLFDTMYAENGIGLAANQVGVLQRVLVIDLDPKNQAAEDPELQADLKLWNYSGPRAFINPEILAAEGDIVWEEGCLSVPGVTDDVRRKERITVRALDHEGNSLTLEMNGLYAVALQHELDHLNGKVFVEYLSRLKRDGIRRRMVRLKQTEPHGAAKGGPTPSNRSL